MNKQASNNQIEFNEAELQVPSNNPVLQVLPALKAGEFSPALQKEIVPEHSYTRLIISLSSILIIAAGITWAANATIEEFTTGDATVIPASRDQIIQSLESGIVSEMFVREGDAVKKGQMLVKLDPTRAGSTYNEGAVRINALTAQAARLKAEALGTELVFPAKVASDVEITKTERQYFNARKHALDESVAALKQSISLGQRELDLISPMVQKGLVAETEELRLKRQINDAQLQIVERKNKLRADASSELSKVEADLASIVETSVGKKDLLEHTDIRSPVNGVVKNIRINTIGGVVPAGAEILEVTPMEDNLLVEVKIKPRDVAFLLKDQHAQVKLTAYEYNVYGGLAGRIVNISPSAIKEEGQRVPGAEDSYYQVLIKTDESELHYKGKVLKIIPGMKATVDIRTGEKTVLNYMLKPLLRVKEAFREK